MRRLAVAVALAGLLLSGCASSRVSSPVLVELAPGMQLRLSDGSTLGYTRLLGDSRCPPEVACIHAGWAEAEFVHARGAAPGHAFVLSTRPGAGMHEADGWRFELLELGPGAAPAAAIRATRRAD